MIDSSIIGLRLRLELHGRLLFGILFVAVVRLIALWWRLLFAVPFGRSGIITDDQCWWPGEQWLPVYSSQRRYWNDRRLLAIGYCVARGSYCGEPDILVLLKRYLQWRDDTWYSDVP